jgi:hypothetical protein
VLAVALHWFNPVIRLSLRQLLRDRELLRDAQALNWLNGPDEFRAYGHTLLKLATQSPPTPIPPGLAALCPTEKEIHRRITMIAQPNTTKKSACRLVLTLSALSCLCLVTFTDAVGQEKPAPVVPVDTTPVAPVPVLPNAPANEPKAIPSADLPSPVAANPTAAKKAEETPKPDLSQALLAQWLEAKKSDEDRAMQQSRTTQERMQKGITELKSRLQGLLNQLEEQPDKSSPKHALLSGEIKSTTTVLQELMEKALRLEYGLRETGTPEASADLKTGMNDALTKEYLMTQLDLLRASSSGLGSKHPTVQGLVAQQRAIQDVFDVQGLTPSRRAEILKKLDKDPLTNPSEDKAKVARTEVKALQAKKIALETKIQYTVPRPNDKECQKLLEEMVQELIEVKQKLLILGETSEAASGQKADDVLKVSALPNTGGLRR